MKAVKRGVLNTKRRFCKGSEHDSECEKLINYVEDDVVAEHSQSQEQPEPQESQEQQEPQKPQEPPVQAGAEVKKGVQPKRPFAKHQSDKAEMCFTPTGNYLLSAANQGNEVRVPAYRPGNSTRYARRTNPDLHELSWEDSPVAPTPTNSKHYKAPNTADKDQSWYLGNISSKKAAKVLKNAETGSWVVRSKNLKIFLVYVDNAKTHQIEIIVRYDSENKKYHSIGRIMTDTIRGLLAHHVRRGVMLPGATCLLQKQDLY